MRFKDPDLPVFEYADGKVIGGQLAEEAKAEILAARKLNEAWKKEFGNKPSNFRTLVSYFEYDAYVISRNNPRDVRVFKLAQTWWTSETDLRLDKFVKPLGPEWYSSQQYIIEFSKQLSQAIKVMHKRLNGTFSSPRGSSISLGNITPEGYVYDYETVQLPFQDNTIPLKQYQLTDIYQALGVITNVAYEIEECGLILDGFRSFYIHYTQNDYEPVEFMKKIERMASANAEDRWLREMITEIVKIIDLSKKWN